MAVGKRRRIMEEEEEQQFLNSWGRRDIPSSFFGPFAAYMDIAGIVPANAWAIMIYFRLGLAAGSWFMFQEKRLSKNKINRCRGTFSI